MQSSDTAETLTLKGISEAIESQLKVLLPSESDLSPELVAGMRYATLEGGKRIRGSLVCATALCLGTPIDRALWPACAIECMHAYSLVHDDLPAMDNASLRHGKPSCHVKFGEAMAILVGDGLQALAFEIICRAPHLESARKLAMLDRLSVAVGPKGMVGGQAMDIVAETSTELSIEELSQLQRAKTGMLITASVELGFIAAGEQMDSPRAVRLTRFGNLVGRAFQIADDLLDLQPSDVTGKPSKLDSELNKQTFLSVLGAEGARREAQELLNQALLALDDCGIDASIRLLQEIATRSVNRSN